MDQGEFPPDLDSLQLEPLGDFQMFNLSLSETPSPPPPPLPPKQRASISLEPLATVTRTNRRTLRIKTVPQRSQMVENGQDSSKSSVETDDDRQPNKRRRSARKERITFDSVLYKHVFSFKQKSVIMGYEFSSFAPVFMLTDYYTAIYFTYLEFELFCQSTLMRILAGEVSTEHTLQEKIGSKTLTWRHHGKCSRHSIIVTDSSPGSEGRSIIMHHTDAFAFVNYRRAMISSARDYFLPRELVFNFLTRVKICYTTAWQDPARASLRMFQREILWYSALRVPCDVSPHFISSSRLCDEFEAVFMNSKDLH